jgi:hypothetical protein
VGVADGDYFPHYHVPPTKKHFPLK